MGDEPHHECGFALLRLLKPWEYYKEKYGTSFYGLNRMYLMMEKQRNRGQDGCGVANVKLDVPPGVKYINCEKSADKDPIKDVFERVQKLGADKLGKAPAEALLTPTDGGAAAVDPLWVKENVPFTGEVFLAHVRYGTDSDNSVERCHPVMRESNWLTRSLSLAGNFNITNNEDLFSSLVQIGQHPRELSDTVTLLEKIGHFVDKENNDLYVKYSATGQDPRTCFSLIAENINIARILRRASSDWDGGYCIAGMFGHGDSFCLRDPNGIRPAFFCANDEIVCVASEAPLIQTVFNVQQSEVKPLPPGQALVIKRNGQWKLESVLPHISLKQCSFERIYFSRGNDAGVYREREHLGRLLLKPLEKMLEDEGDSLSNTVLSFIPNTSELAFNGLAKEAQDEVARKRSALMKSIMDRKQRGELANGAVEEELKKVANLVVRTEKVVHKDAKIRTFIQEDSSRESLTMHAYDVHYGTVRPHEDVLVALDDSIVRGNTLKNAILRTLDRMGPKRILVLSSCPQIRYPDVYGIDMAKLGDLAAFRAAITMLQERKMEHILGEVYRACRSQLAKPLAGTDFVNHVRRIYEPFTAEEISNKIVEQVTPPGCNAKIGILFNTVEALHVAMPEHAGDWYFTGHYPTPGGVKVCCRAFVLWFEGSSARCYGVSSANSTVQTPVLVLGNGAGSEHVLAWKLSQSHEVGCVYMAPGNMGASGHSTHGHRCGDDEDDGAAARQHTAPVVPVDLPLNGPDFKEVIAFCKERNIVMAVVASEPLLQQGLSDAVRNASVPAFAPSMAAAELDSSNPFSRNLMKKLEVPFVEASKAEGTGYPEVSVLAFSDGQNVSVLPAASRDQKHANDDDRGPVTEGMGSFAPCPLADEVVMQTIQENVCKPIFEGMKKDGRAFTGCLQIELMLLPAGPSVIRFRACINNPVAETLLPLLEGDLFEIMQACTDGRLSPEMLKLRRDRCTVSVVMTSTEQQPQQTDAHAISGLDRAICVPGAHVFHTGTKVEIPKASSGKLPQQQRSSPHLQPRKYSMGNMPSLVLSQKLMTSGSRILTVAATGRSIMEARERAYVAVRAISFEHASYRHDIAATIHSPATNGRPLNSKSDDSEFTYRAAGVDHAAAKAALASFEPFMRRTGEKKNGSSPAETQQQDVIKGSVFKAPNGGGTFVSSVNNLGTKLKIAARIGSTDGLGIDLVALCVNEIAARGAEPLFFQDHFSTEKLDAHQAMQLVKGVSDGCVEAGCRFLSAGVSELPGVFSQGGFDFVGFAVGMAEENRLLPQRDLMQKGDIIIGLPSSGLHCNGFSLVRAVIRASGLDYSQAAPFDPTRSLGEALMPPSRIYARSVLALARAGLLRGATQPTDGGLEMALGRLLPKHLAAQLKAESWELPAVLRWLAAVGKVPFRELVETFNCGLGMVLIVPPEHQEKAIAMLTEMHEEPVIVGKLSASSENSHRVDIEGAQGAWLMLPELGVSLPFPEVLSSLQDPWTGSRLRVMVLAGSESVTPMQALIKAIKVPASAASLVGVASIDVNSKALAHARAAGIRDFVLSRSSRKNSAEFSLPENGHEAVGPAEEGAGGLAGMAADGRESSKSLSVETSSQLELMMQEVQAEMLVVLDDVDPAILTRAFIQHHAGKVLICHAALLPAFPGRCPLEAAMRAGVCVTGFTICFAVPPTIGARGGCYGPPILQEPVRVDAADTVMTLRSRVVAECEVLALPKAVQLVASGSVALRADDEGYGVGRSASGVLSSDAVAWR